MKKGLNKKLDINIRSLLISILSVVFVFGGSFTIYYLSKGYRVDVSGREIIKTGVLTVQSDPSSANLYIDGEEVGRTPRSRILNTGVYDVSVWKKGYREWRKDIEIKAEKSTPIFPLIFLEEPEKKIVWESENRIVKYWSNQYRDYFIFLIQNDDGSHSLWVHRVNNSLWNLNPNPMEILKLETGDIELDISANGQLAILEIIEEGQKNHYLIEILKSNTLSKNVSIEGIELEEYDISWAKDNKHIILESQESILSVEIVKNTISTLIQKSSGQNYIWSTDEEGFFYTLQPLHTEDDSTYIYTLEQMRLDGTNSKYTIEKVYFHKDLTYIEHYRENGNKYQPFSNSPLSTQSIGQILHFEVDQTSKGVYIQTETSSYWYSIEKDMYQMIAPYPTKLILFAPDSKKILLSNGDNIYVYTLDKEEADHTAEIGSKKVKGIVKEEVSELNWLSNSSYISFTKDNYICIAEKDGDNKQDVIDAKNVLLYSIRSSKDTVITLERIEETFVINQYKIQ
jgi:hypothetical protein